jgi:hypothetical protein
MSCPTCRRVFGRKCVASCKCGDCNLCHGGYWCPNGKTWWSEVGDPESQAKLIPGQSHGGGGCPIISCSCIGCFKPRISKYSNNKFVILSHCGNTCRHNLCKH